VDSLGIKNYDVSAKTGDGVGFLFEEICRDLVKKSKILKAATKGTRLEGNSNDKVKKSGCC
jgi:hypothetical protein